MWALMRTRWALSRNGSALVPTTPAPIPPPKPPPARIWQVWSRCGAALAPAAAQRDERQQLLAPFRFLTALGDQRYIRTGEQVPHTSVWVLAAADWLVNPKCVHGSPLTAPVRSERSHRNVTRVSPPRQQNARRYMPRIHRWGRTGLSLPTTINNLRHSV